MSGAGNTGNTNGMRTTSSPQPSGGRQQLKSSTSGKTIENVRKQTGSPNEGAQRKPPNAWASGQNPLSQRPTSKSTINGVGNASKPSSNPRSPVPSSADSQPLDKAATDRLVRSLRLTVGKEVSLTVKGGERFTAIFTGFRTEDSFYSFKMVQRAQQANGVGESSGDYVGAGDDHVMTIHHADVVSMIARNTAFDRTQSRGSNGTSRDFRTDTAISGNSGLRERELKPFDFGAHQPGPELSLGDHGSGAKWDQFEANKHLVTGKSDYNENHYTTVIDRSKANYAEVEAKAAKLEREILSGLSSNAHVAEERGQVSVDDSGLDEEEKYSGVRRDYSAIASGQPNRYTPPARRAPTGQATVAGAPVDPAIISSQIARPDSAAKTAAAKSQDAPVESARTGAPASSTTGQTAKGEPRSEATSMEKKPIAQAASGETASRSNVPIKPQDAAAAATARKASKAGNDSESLEQAVLEKFAMFAQGEKQRHLDQQKQREIQKEKQARTDKALKLNDLRKFATNFKLHTPVPKDLVPILAKDKDKQEQIVEKNLKNIKEKQATTPSKPAALPTDLKSARVTPGKYDPSSPGSANAQRQRQNQANFNNGMRPANGNVNAIPPRANPGMLGQRLQNSHQQHKAGMMTSPPNMSMQDPRIPSGPAANANAGIRFNAKAMEFRPNPGAATFQPGGSGPSNHSSPRVQTPAKAEPKKPAITKFNGGKKATPVDLSVFDKAFDVIGSLKSAAESEGKQKDYASNGGIPQAYRTNPTFADLVPEANREKTMADMLPGQPATPQSHSGPVTPMGGPMAHQHQLPAHLQQQGPQGYVQGNTPQHTPRHNPAQPHHGHDAPHFQGGHPMQFSASSSSAHPSPRPHHQYVYNQPMAQGMPPGGVFQQGMPGYVMAPGVQQFRQAGGPQFMGPMPGMGGQMMTQQPSNGQYMQAQMPMFAGGYPQHAPMQGPPGAGGYPNSPRPAAQMMAHSGSQQGHPGVQGVVYVPPGGMPPQVMMGQPGPMNHQNRQFMQQQMQFGSPHQMHAYPQGQQQPHRGTPSATYAQPMMPTQSMPGHGGPVPTGPHGASAEDNK